MHCISTGSAGAGAAAGSSGGGGGFLRLWGNMCVWRWCTPSARDVCGVVPVLVAGGGGGDGGTDATTMPTTSV